MQMHIHTINIDNYYVHVHTHATKNVPLFILCALSLLYIDRLVTATNPSYQRVAMSVHTK